MFTYLRLGSGEDAAPAAAPRPLPSPHAGQYARLERATEASLEAERWDAAVASANEGLGLPVERLGEDAARARARLLELRARARVGQKDYFAALHDCDMLLGSHRAMPPASFHDTLNSWYGGGFRVIFSYSPDFIAKRTRISRAKFKF